MWLRLCCPQVDEDGGLIGTDPANYFFGVNAVFHTSELLRKLTTTQRLLSPTGPSAAHGRWFCPPEGAFGWHKWDEATNPAASVYELRDHAAGMVAAMLGYAHWCDAHMLRKHDFAVREAWLMPLWRLLREAQERRSLDAAAIFALHASLLSILFVQGERRIARVAVTARVRMGQIHDQLTRALPLWGLGGVDADGAPVDAELRSSGLSIALLLAQEYMRVLSSRLGLDPLRVEQARDADSAAQVPRARQLRDAALLTNPWVGGQQILFAQVSSSHLSLPLSSHLILLSLLFAQMACGMGYGVLAADSGAQMRFALHLYNALRRVGVRTQWLEPPRGSNSSRAVRPYSRGLRSAPSP